MWYETLPFAGVMFACIFLANYGGLPYNYVMYRRATLNRYAANKLDQAWLDRDFRLNGDAFIAKGLESVPDN